MGRAVMQPKCRVKRATLVYDDERNAAKTVHGYGFRAVCGCGWESRVAASYGLARRASKAHAEYHRASPRVTVAGPV